MNYDEMSDFEINKAVAEAIGFQTAWQADNKIGIADGSACGRYVDYCNDPADAWPIIELLFKRDITLIMNSTGVMTNNAGVEFNGKSFDVEGSPLRAAMIVFLMMQEQSDEN